MSDETPRRRRRRSESADKTSRRKKPSGAKPAKSKPRKTSAGRDSAPEPRTVKRKESDGSSDRRSAVEAISRACPPSLGADPDAPFVLEREDHPISRSRVTSATLKTLYRLKKGGYRAYLCGGAVRDLMLGGDPKDFDIATDAEPQQVRRLFRNARIIGRRFRLVHVLFHEETVEVATFRRTPDPDEQRGGPDAKLITSDNAFGTPCEDAFRRDFTINGLYYDIASFAVIDYVGGIDDLEDGLVRVIGDPDLRFCEDPVRMLRACEFAGRLDFDIEEETAEAIRRNRRELAKAAPPRLTEELVQLLRCGRAEAAFQWMLQLEVLDFLLPEVVAMIAPKRRGVGGFEGIVSYLDRQAQAGVTIDDSVLLGALFLPELLGRRFEHEQRTGQWMPTSAFRDAVDKVLRRFQQRFALANAKRSMLFSALEGFHRLCDQNWTPQQRVRFASKSYFDDALQLFRILVASTGEGHDVLSHWEAARKQRTRRPEPQVDRKRRSRRPKRRSGRRRS